MRLKHFLHFAHETLRNETTTQKKIRACNAFILPRTAFRKITEFQFSSVETVSRRRPRVNYPAFEPGRCGRGERPLGSWLMGLWQRSAAIYEAEFARTESSAYVVQRTLYTGMPHRNRKLLSTPAPSRPAPPRHAPASAAVEFHKRIRLLKSKPILSWQFMLATRTYAYGMSSRFHIESEPKAPAWPGVGYTCD